MFTQQSMDKNTKVSVEDNQKKLDAVEDILLDDFSIGDESSTSQDGSDVQRTSSIDSNQSINIKRHKGKVALKDHSNICLETLHIKID